MINPIENNLTEAQNELYLWIQNYVKEILLVSEEEIMDSLNIIINKLKIVVEPSSAVVLAALIKNNKKFKNKNIGLIMCGGNIDFNSLKF